MLCVLCVPAAMWGGILATILQFRGVIGNLAVLLLGPYLLWVSYASALTIWIWQHNSTPATARKVRVRERGTGWAPATADGLTASGKALTDTVALLVLSCRASRRLEAGLTSQSFDPSSLRHSCEHHHHACSCPHTLHPWALRNMPAHCINSLKVDGGIDRVPGGHRPWQSTGTAHM
jgi:hypothetical protein